MQKPKGTYDIFGKKADQMLYLRKLMNALMDKYNVKYFETPIFESSDLFHRGVGETTDIVSKETYDFKDRGNRSLTLRPEGTAGIVRCFIENKLYAENLPLKAWYFGPMFRYERPQAGRFREFYQFGVEMFGSYDPIMDAEVISILVNFFKMLGLKGIKVNINSLGDSESREAYRKSLISHFKPYLDDLCEDCQNRFSKNPLRILDCKVDCDKEFMKKAPKMTDFLNKESVRHFDMVKKYLDEMGIDYVENPNIVRGLDYYTHTVFEIEADIKGFGSQNVLGAGGRYNNLVQNIGGPDIPGVGFAIGIERLLLALEMEGIDITSNSDPEIYVVPMGKDSVLKAFNLVNVLRLSGFNTEMDYNNRNLKSNFKNADRLHAKFIIIVGEEEINTKTLTIKDNSTKEEFKIKLDKLVEFLDDKILSTNDDK
ncbi:MAG: histidine--tRNA ligase [Bacilli bacterium]|nr:histidine--tRNA ligase [Bacilli bacterium]